MTDLRHDRFSGPYQLFMLMLCLFALVALAADTVVPLSPSTREILQWG